MLRRRRCWQSCPRKPGARVEILDARGQPFVLRRLPEIIPGGVQQLPVTLRFRNLATGEERWSVVQAQPVPDGRAQVTLVVSALQDVTELKRAEQEQHLLAEASRVLAASLDYSTGLANLVRLVVPALADWCVVDVLTEDGAVHRLAIAHADPAKAELAQQLQRRYPILQPQATHTILKVLHTGQSWIDPEISESRFVAEARDAEHLQLLRALGFKSEMVVPLQARGRTLGTMTLVRAEARDRYGPADLALAEELARRVAVAVDSGH